MTTQISPMLAVTHGSAAMEFYQAEFRAQLLWKLGRVLTLSQDYPLTARHSSSPIMLPNTARAVHLRWASQR